MAAFNWSPGGCCCVEPGMFDLYGWITDPKVLRFRTIYPDGLAPTNSDEFWSIATPDTPTLLNSGLTHTVNPGSGSELVWAIQSRPQPPIIGGASDTYLALYDAITQQELMHVPYHDGLSGGDQIVLTLSSVAPDGSKVISIARPFQLTLPPGTFRYHETTAGGVISPSKLIRVSTTASGQTTTFDRAARKAWPKAIGTTTSSGGTVTFFIGDVAFTDFNGSTYGPVFTNQQSFKSISGTGRWVFFDYETDGTWVGTIAWQTPAGILHTALVINGQQIEEFSSPSLSTGLFGEQGSVYSNVHAAYPHESLGGGFVTVGRKDFQEPPSQSFPQGLPHDPDRPWVLRGYKAGQQIWQSGRATESGTARPNVWQSSDRWLYAEIQAAPLEMPGGLYSFPAKTTRRWHLIKHDGSQSVVVGKVSGTPLVMDQYNNETLPNERHPVNAFWPGIFPKDFYCVRNSALVERSLPADGNEFA